MTPGTFHHHTLNPRVNFETVVNTASLLFFVVLRCAYGLAWIMAGVTKETEKHWWSEPGLFLRQYLLEALDKPNVVEPYKHFLRIVVMENLLIFNYTIPVVQVIAGALIMIGLFTLPMLFVCLFMHINFVLSGNMNEISLFLYTAVFVLFIGWSKTISMSVDARLKSTRLRRQGTQLAPAGVADSEIAVNMRA
ncbi:hypothetical protein [Deinococcus deserti]|nr:hypothetical protein [Deinococcus deserti]